MSVKNQSISSRVSSSPTKSSKPDLLTKLILNKQGDAFILSLAYKYRNQAENGNTRFFSGDSSTDVKISLETNHVEIKSKLSEYAEKLIDNSMSNKKLCLQASKKAIEVKLNEVSLKLQQKNNQYDFLYFEHF